MCKSSKKFVRCYSLFSKYMYAYVYVVSVKAGSQYDVGPTFRFVSSLFPVKPQRHVTFHHPVHNVSSIGR